MPRRREQEATDLTGEFHRGLLDLRADYEAAGVSRYLPAVRGTRSEGSGADWHYRSEPAWLRMIERMRHYDRNNMVIGQAVDRLTTNVIQDGFTLDPDQQDEGFKQEIKDRWYDWADNPAECDYFGEDSFADLEAQIFRSSIIDGDMLGLPLADEGSVQLVEAHRCRRPSNTKANVIHGVELDASGKPLRYWITKNEVDPLAPLARVGDVQKYDRRDDDGELAVLHVKQRSRKSQTRGVSPLARAVFPTNYHDDLQFAKLVQAQVVSCYAILEEQISGIPEIPPRTGADAQTGALTSETDRDGSTRTSEGMAPGMRVRGKPGWSLKGFSPAVPNVEFFQHATLILTLIAINLGLPVHVLLLDPSRTNFSGWRGAIDEARKGWRVLQRRLIRQFHTPIYRWKMRQWAAEDRHFRERMETMTAREFFAHTWNPPTWQYIEPLKDIQANSLELATSQTSRRRQAARRGEDHAEIDRELVADNANLIRLAQREAYKLNREKEFAEDNIRVSWRDIAALPLPDGLSLALSPEKEPAEPEPAAPPRDEARAPAKQEAAA